jgi:hypothetical protein
MAKSQRPVVMDKLSSSVGTRLLVFEIYLDFQLDHNWINCASCMSIYMGDSMYMKTVCIE